jgi:hypothetical protein
VTTRARLSAGFRQNELRTAVTLVNRAEDLRRLDQAWQRATEINSAGGRSRVSRDATCQPQPAAGLVRQAHDRQPAARGVVDRGQQRVIDRIDQVVEAVAPA